MRLVIDFFIKSLFFLFVKSLLMRNIFLFNFLLKFFFFFFGLKKDNLILMIWCFLIGPALKIIELIDI